MSSFAKKCQSCNHWRLRPFWQWLSYLAGAFLFWSIWEVLQNNCEVGSYWAEGTPLIERLAVGWSFVGFWHAAIGVALGVLIAVSYVVMWAVEESKK